MNNPNDIAAPASAGDESNGLAARMVRLSDTQSRGIARLLHDSAAQLAAAVCMNLDVVRARAKAGQDRDALLAECAELAAQCDREIRKVTYILHPPLIDELGLAAALRAYAEGLTAEAGIPVTVETGGAFGRLDPAAELGIFKIVQEWVDSVRGMYRIGNCTVRLERPGTGVAVRVACHRLAALPAPQGATVDPGAATARLRVRAAQLGGTVRIEPGPEEVHLLLSVSPEAI